MQDIVPYVLDSISTRPYYTGKLFVGFLTNQAKKRLERNFSVFLLRTLVVGRRQHSKSIEVALDME